MILIAHILIALSSILYATGLLFAPNKQKFKVAYTLIGLTLASGTYLTISLRANMVRVCMSGLVYLSVTSFILAIAHRRLQMRTVVANTKIEN